MKKKLSIFALFILIILLMKFFDLDTYVTFENLKDKKDVLAQFVQNNYFLAIVAFVMMYIVSVSFMIPIAMVLTISGGFLFGSISGLLFVNIGATIGAVLSFLLARYLLGEKFQSKYKNQLLKFNHELETNKYQYLFSLRFLPIFPFFLVNFLCGVTRLDLRAFIITTAFGTIPGSFVFTYAGSKLAKINALSDIFTKEILFAFILLGTLTLLPVLVKKIKASRLNKND